MYNVSVHYSKLREQQGTWGKAWEAAIAVRSTRTALSCILLQLHHIITTASLNHYYSNYFLIITLLQNKNGDLGWNSLQKSGALCFLEASPPRSAFAEIRVAGFAAGRAAREASLGVCASTRKCLPAWTRNNPSFCNKNSFEHVHTSISGNFRILDGVQLAVIPAVSTLAGSLDRRSEYKKLRGTKHLRSNNHKNIQQKL